MRIEMIRIDEVIIGERHRKNLGDLTELSTSIREHGLLQPIGVTAERKLLFGHRRLEAAKLIPLEQIAAHVFERLDDAVEALKLERDENTCRKDFTKSEAVALGRELEKLEREKAEERQKVLGRNHGEDPSGNFHQGSHGRTDDKVGEAIGMSGRTYSKARAVVQAAEENPEKFGHLVEQMDATGKVSPAYDELKKHQSNSEQRTHGKVKDHVANIERLAAGGYRASQIAEEIGLTEQTVRLYANKAGIELPDAKIGKVQRINARRVIESTVHGLEGYAQGLQTINGAVREVDPSLAAEWADSLKGSLAPIQRLRKQLLEVANGN